MMIYVCSSCGEEAYYDGRCGDGPILMCGCDKRSGQTVDEGSRGSYQTNPSGAKPVEKKEWDQYNPDDSWDF